jgi:hypothetical protein
MTTCPSNESGRQRWRCRIICAALFIGCCVMAGKIYEMRMREIYAQGQVEVLLDIKGLARSSSTVSELQQLIDYARGFYKSGSYQIPGSHLDRMVEAVRSNVVDELVERSEELRLKMEPR